MFKEDSMGQGMRHWAIINHKVETLPRKASCRGTIKLTSKLGGFCIQREPSCDICVDTTTSLVKSRVAYDPLARLLEK